MAETELLRRMVDDVASLKEQMTRIEITINEIDSDIHRELNPEYLKKLEKIQKQKGIRFKSAEEFDAYFSD
jgi:transposase